MNIDCLCYVGLCNKLDCLQKIRRLAMERNLLSSLEINYYLKCINVNTIFKIHFYNIKIISNRFFFLFHKSAKCTFSSTDFVLNIIHTNS